MKEETFNKVVSTLQSSLRIEGELHGYGIHLEHLESYHEAITALLGEFYPKHKIDTLYWFIYEYRKGKMIISDSKTKKVLFNLDKEGHLWKYMAEV